MDWVHLDPEIISGHLGLDANLTRICSRSESAVVLCRLHVYVGALCHIIGKGTGPAATVDDADSFINRSMRVSGRSSVALAWSVWYGVLEALCHI